MVESNNILYRPEEKPDHCVVIKYVPYVGKYAKNIIIKCSSILFDTVNYAVLSLILREIFREVFSLIVLYPW